MGTPGYKVIINSGGTPTTMTTEATTSLGNSGRIFQITNSAKRLISRLDAVSVYANAVLQSSTGYIINYLTGTVKFLNTVGVPTAPVTITGKYIPVAEVGGALSYSMSIAGDILADDNFKDCRVSECHQKMYGLNDVSISLTINYNKTFLYNAAFHEEKLSGSVVNLVIYPGGESFGYAGWFVIESNNKSGEVSAVEGEEVSFVLDGDFNSSFSVINPDFQNGITVYGDPTAFNNGDWRMTTPVNGRPSYIQAAGVTSWDGSRWNMSHSGLGIPYLRSRTPHGLTPDQVTQWEDTGSTLVATLKVDPLMI